MFQSPMLEVNVSPWSFRRPRRPDGHNLLAAAHHSSFRRVHIIYSTHLLGQTDAAKPPLPLYSSYTPPLEVDDARSHFSVPAQGMKEPYSAQSIQEKKKRNYRYQVTILNTCAHKLDTGGSASVPLPLSSSSSLPLPVLLL